MIEQKKKIYVFKVKLKELKKITQISNNLLYLNQLYILNQELQFQVYNLEKYQRSLLKCYTRNNLEKIFKFSFLFELIIISFILNELFLRFKDVSRSKKNLEFLTFLENKNSLKYHFFCFLNKTKKNISFDFSLNSEKNQKLLKKDIIAENFFLEKIKNSVYSKSIKIKKLKILVMNKFSLCNFNLFRKTKKKNLSLNRFLWGCAARRKPKNFFYMSRKSDFLIKNLFYKQFFLNSLNPFFESKINSKNILVCETNKKFNSLHSSQNQTKSDLFIIFKKIFLLLYLEPKFTLTLIIYLSRKTITFFINKLKFFNAKKQNFTKNLLSNLLIMNIKAPLLRKLSSSCKLANKKMYLQPSLQNSFLMTQESGNNFIPIAKIQSINIKKKKLTNFNLMNLETISFIFYSLSKKETLILYLNFKSVIGILNKFFYMLNFNNYLKIILFVYSGSTANRNNLLLFNRNNFLFFLSNFENISKQKKQFELLNWKTNQKLILNKNIKETINFKNLKNNQQIYINSNCNFSFLKTLKFSLNSKFFCWFLEKDRFFLIKSKSIGLKKNLSCSADKIQFNQKKTYQLYKSDLVKKSDNINLNLVEYSYKKTSISYFSDSIDLFLQFKSFSKFLKILSNLIFLKISPNKFLVKFFLINFEKKILNYFYSKISYYFKNLIDKNFFLSYPKENLKLFFRLAQEPISITLIEKKNILLKKNQFTNYFDGVSKKLMLFKSKEKFVVLLQKYTLLNLFFNKFSLNMNINYTLKLLYLKITKFHSNCTRRLNFSCEVNRSKKTIKKPEIIKVCKNINLVYSSIILNSQFFSGAHQSYFMLTRQFLQKLIFLKEFKSFQDLINGLFMFYEDDFLIFQKNYGFISNNKKNILQFIYYFNLSIKRVSFNHSQFILNKKTPGFLFNGFLIYQITKKKNIKKFKNFKGYVSSQNKNNTYYLDSLNLPQKFESKISYQFKINIIPSKTNLKNHLNQLKYIFFKFQSKNQEDLIKQLSPKVYKWLNYYRIILNKSIFNKLNFFLTTLTLKWCIKRHQNKNRNWIKEKYFFSLINVNYFFAVKKYETKNSFKKLRLKKI